MAKKQEDLEPEDEIVVIDEPQVTSGEIDSTEEEESTKEVKQKTKPVKKRGNDHQKRISELWMQRKEAEDLARKEAASATAERARNAEYEKITASALEENIATKRELLTERLQRAEEAGDTAAKAKITAEMGKIEAQAAQMDRYKIENQVRQPDNQRQQVQQRQQEEPVGPASFEDLYDSLNETGKKWLDAKRDWYDNQSDNYDEERVADVTLYARGLEAAFERNGSGAPPGSKGYFRQIDDYIKQNWSDDVTDENEDPAPRKNYAAPVGNRGSTPTQNGARKEFKITPAEKEMALSLDSKDKTGKPLSDADKIKRFLTVRDSIPSSGPISMATIRKGAN